MKNRLKFLSVTSYIKLVLLAHSQYTEIWNNEMGPTNEGWECRIPDDCVYNSLSTMCLSSGDGVCIKTTTSTTTNNWVIKSADISSYSLQSLQFEFWVNAKNVIPPDYCQVWVRYDSGFNNRFLRRKRLLKDAVLHAQIGLENADDNRHNTAETDAEGQNINEKVAKTGPLFADRPSDAFAHQLQDFKPIHVIQVRVDEVPPSADTISTGARDHKQQQEVANAWNNEGGEQLYDGEQGEETESSHSSDSLYENVASSTIISTRKEVPRVIHKKSASFSDEIINRFDSEQLYNAELRIKEAQTTNGENMMVNETLCGMENNHCQ